MFLPLAEVVVYLLLFNFELLNSKNKVLIVIK